ncbi:fumarylacetoacetate hydrolase domain-containing protein 2a-related [Anaeramoeba flamelloides]|uniref:Fumarylacetoacetate hydrolase domain-containing protein 2a-related n=1 Tax=Anaeramoeba flamelloides TaxID=1746091 RepID=A0ABQ8XFQ6_9EUKA|nr:fumarylacetoacetate hydrolase domain-containing protein 2a-related [Anaeramoeba flamelloides]
MKLFVFFLFLTITLNTFSSCLEYGIDSSSENKEKEQTDHSNTDPTDSADNDYIQDISSNKYQFENEIEISEGSTQAKKVNPKEREQGLVKLARIKKGTKRQVVLITGEQNTKVSYINLSERLGIDSEELYDYVRSDNLKRIKELGTQDQDGEILVSGLIPPVDGKDVHICAGLNYRSHQTEMLMANKVLIFPKMGKPTAAYSDVYLKNRKMFDYELEIGVYVPIDIQKETDLADIPFGFFLANDLTERDVQVRKFQKGTAAGFALSKSFEGSLPIGPYVVFPIDRKAFLNALTLELKLNGKVRQQSHSSLLVSNVDELIKNTFNVERDWEGPNGRVKLIPGDTIAKGTLILTGTPGGTIFQVLKTSQKIQYAFSYFLKAKFLNDLSMVDSIKEEWIRSEISSGKYLKNGDIVEATISELGTQKLKIVE